MSRTTISIKKETHKRIVQTRGKMEHEDGKRRTVDDVINELIDYFEEKK